MFNKSKDVQNLLLKENKRLKRENENLRECLNRLQHYKDEYEKLIDDVRNLKVQYVEKINGFDILEREYKKELSEIIRKNKNKK